MSRSLSLDFLASPSRPAAWAWLLLAGGLALAAWSAQDWLAARDDHARAQARLEGLARTARPVSKKTARPDAGAQSRRQAEAAAQRQLNLPWNELLQALQRSRSGDVALLSLQGDGQRGDFQIDAQARTPEVMLAYLGRLQRDPALRQVTLTQHQGAEADGTRVVRFTLRGGWGRP